MKNNIALYSCNFGNYRNELGKNNIDNLIIDNNIDYYFFTDNNKLTSDKWKIVLTPVLQKDNIMDEFRWTVKNIKFVLPELLKDYDIIVWIDNKVINNKLIITVDNVKNLFFENEYKLFNIIHPIRKTAIEELNETIRCRFENIDNANKFINEIKNIKHNSLLPDTCFIIRKNDEENNKLFKHVYDLLKEKGLKRDQNVYNHAIYDINYPIENICYITIDLKIDKRYKKV